MPNNPTNAQENAVTRKLVDRLKESGQQNMAKTVKRVHALNQEEEITPSADITPADLATMRQLAERWPEVFFISEYQGGANWDLIITEHLHQSPVFRFFDSKPGYFTKDGPAILVHALQEVMRQEGLSLIVWPLEAGYIGFLESSARPRRVTVYSLSDAVTYGNPHPNPAIAALRCVGAESTDTRWRP